MQYLQNIIHTDPRYSFLSEYDLLKHCMTEVDNYLFKNEPRVFMSPRKSSQRWEEQHNVQHEIYEEDIEMEGPTLGALSSTSAPIIPSSSQSTRQIVPYAQQQRQQQQQQQYEARAFSTLTQC